MVAQWLKRVKIIKYRVKKRLTKNWNGDEQ